MRVACGVVNCHGAWRRIQGLLWVVLVLICVCALLPADVDAARPVRKKGTSYALETVRHDLDRGKGKHDSVVMDLSNFLTRRESKRLVKQTSSRLSQNVDFSVLIASNVEQGYSSKEMATTLLNRWKMGTANHHLGGVLVLLVLEEQRIEVELSDSLNHILDSNWCNEILYTKIVPYFREEAYIKGLELLIEEIAKRLEAYRYQREAATNRGRKNKKRRRLARSKWLGLSGFLGLGGYAARDRWLPFLVDDNDDEDYWDDGHDSYDKPRYRSPRRHSHDKPRYQSQRKRSDHGLDGRLASMIFSTLLSPKSYGSTSATSKTATLPRTAMRPPTFSTPSMAEEPAPKHHTDSTTILNNEKAKPFARTGLPNPPFVPKQQVQSLRSTARQNVKAAVLRQQQQNPFGKTTKNTVTNRTPNSSSGDTGAGANWGKSTAVTGAPKASSKASSGTGGSGASWNSSVSKATSSNDKKKKGHGSSGQNGGSANWNQ